LVRRFLFQWCFFFFLGNSEDLAFFKGALYFNRMLADINVATRQLVTLYALDNEHDVDNIGAIVDKM